MAYKFNPFTGKLEEYGPVLTGTGTVSAAADGTAGSPGIAFANDLNTGIYRPGADQVAISTGGTGRLFVDSAGRVGVGTASPDKTLSIATSNGNGALIRSGAYGTTGSNATLYLSGGGYDDGQPAGFAIASEQVSINNHVLKFCQSTANADGSSYAISTERARIDSSGNFGIGTSSPIQKLQVAGSAIIGRNSADASNTDALFLHSRGANSNNNLEVGLAAVYHGPQPSDSALTISPKFWNGSGYVLTERVRVTAAGEVGIGTASPGATLDVNGGLWARSSFISWSGTTRGGDILTTAAGRLTIRSYNGTGVDGGEIIFVRNNTGGDLESARIDSSGRLLVGTSSALSISTIQIAGRSDGIDDPVFRIDTKTTTPANNINLGSIFFGTTAQTGGNRGADIVAARDGGTWTSNSSHPTRLVFSTTADAASSPTERLRISENGDLRIANATTFYPSVDNAISIGASVLRFSAVFAANGTIQTSDEREKTEVAEAILGSDFVKSLRPVSYKWIEGGKRDTGERDESNNYIYKSVPGQRTHWGFIAQEVKEAVDAAGVDFGGWVLTDKDDPGSQQALRYDQFIAPLTKALQEALAKIETLEAKVAALEAA